MDSEPTVFRFGLRTLLFAFSIVAICAACPGLFTVLAWPIRVTGPTAVAAAFIVVRRLTPNHTRCSVSNRWIFLFSAAIPLCGFMFARHRWLNAFRDTLFPRPLPYPDVYLVQIHDWWDRLHPVEPTSMKIHGEYYSVLLGINALLFFSCVLFGGVAGLIPTGRND